MAAAGLVARQLSQSDARLVVSPSSPGTPLEAPALAALAAAAAEIVDLNLADTALDDADLQAIGALPAATHLRLARNGLTDDALAGLATSPQLEHLNFYGNAGVTDASLETLAAIATLRELYLGRPACRPPVRSGCARGGPDLNVDTGSAAPRRELGCGAALTATGTVAGSAHHPSPIFSASRTAVPVTIVPRMPRRHQKYAVPTRTA